jgi:hypothetical protein
MPYYFSPQQRRSVPRVLGRSGRRRSLLIALAGSEATVSLLALRRELGTS